MNCRRLTPGRILYHSGEDLRTDAARGEPYLSKSPGSWYALHVRSCTESLVAGKLEEASIEAFYPHVLRESNDQRLPSHSIESKFFPGYVFGKFDLLRRHAVVSIHQVVAILGFGYEPVAIPDSEIDAVRQMVTCSPQSVDPCPFVAVGDRVAVMRGPLRGLEGFVELLPNNKARVRVAISMLARSISTEVDRDTLRTVSTGSESQRTGAVFA